MDAANSNLNCIFQKFKADLGRDWKKTAVLAVLLVVGAVVAVRLLAPSRGPRPASASIAPAGVADGRPAQTDAGGPDGRAERREQYLAVMDRSIKRDLFHFDPAYFPPDGRQGVSAPHEPEPQVQPDGAARALAAAEQSRRQHVELITAQGMALALQSTMLGDVPTAVIDGRVRKIGDIVNGFRLTAVGDQFCVVSKDSVDVRLDLKRPTP